MTSLDGMLDISELVGRVIDHELGDCRRCHRCLSTNCLLSSLRRRFLVYVPLPRDIWLRLCARFCEFPISDVLNLDLEGL